MNSYLCSPLSAQANGTRRPPLRSGSKAREVPVENTAKVAEDAEARVLKVRRRKINFNTHLNIAFAGQGIEPS